MREQLTLFDLPKEKKQTDNLKRNWENAFQRWSDNKGLFNHESTSTNDWGCCGFGSMCDWCTDNSYGRPCVRALNAMLRETGKRIDYTDRDFKKVWRGQIKRAWD